MVFRAVTHEPDLPAAFKFRSLCAREEGIQDRPENELPIFVSLALNLKCSVTAITNSAHFTGLVF